VNTEFTLNLSKLSMNRSIYDIISVIW